METPICPGMTVDQVIEKITVNQSWAIQAFCNFVTAPPKERATFALALHALVRFAASLPDLTKGQAGASWAAYIFYLGEKKSDIQAEAAGLIDLTEKMRLPITEDVPSDSVNSPSNGIIEQIFAAARASKTGTPWPEDLTKKVLLRKEQGELYLLVRKAPLGLAEIKEILSYAREIQDAGLIMGVYAHNAIPWSEVEEALAKSPLDINIAYAACDRKDLTDKALHRLASARDKGLLTALFYNHEQKLKDCHYQDILDLVSDPLLEAGMARSPKTPHWVLLSLAKNPNLDIQMELAARTDLPESLLSQLREISSHLASVNVEQKLCFGQELSRGEIKTGLTSPYKSVRVSTITKGVGKKR